MAAQVLAQKCVFILCLWSDSCTVLQVNFGTMCSDIVEVVSQLIQTVPMSFVAGSSGNLVEWAEHTIESKSKLAQIVDKVTVGAGEEYEGVAYKAYDAVFASNEQLSRFPSLQKEVKTFNIPKRIQEALNAATPIIAVMASNAEQQLYNGTLSQQDVVQRFHQLKYSMGRCIVEHMVKFLKHSPLSLPAGFQLIEDEVTAKDRRSLQEQMDRVNQAIMQLEEMKSDSFLEYGTAGSQATGTVNPLQHLEGAPHTAVAEVQDNRSVDPDLYADSPTAAAVQRAGDYADSPTAMDVQRREADPLPFSANHWQNGPKHVTDSTGKSPLDCMTVNRPDLVEFADEM